VASPQHRDETNAAYGHSAGNYGMSYGFAFINFDGFDGTFK